MTADSSKSLSLKIFTTVLTFTLVVVVALSVLLTCAYYFAYEGDYAQNLQAKTQAVARYLDETADISEKNLQTCAKLADNMRVTLIAPDGTVLFDSVEKASAMGNHADRPEIAQALSGGKGTFTRYSQTVYTDTLYSALRLDNGDVIRLSENRPSIWAFMGNLAIPFCIVIIVTVIFVLILSRLLTRRIMRPIDALDFSEPLENNIYHEMKPLLARIDEQQRQLKEQNIKLAQAESLRRDFSANVSHEMKTPLQVISGYSELMENGVVPPEDIQKVSGVIHDEALSMRKLVDDVLMLSKLDELPASTALSDNVDLYAVATVVVERLQGLARKHGVTLQVTGESVYVKANESLIEEVIYNLVDNGIRYNYEGGVVDVDVTVIPASSDEEADLARVTVHNTGIGIPKEAQEKVFERFYRVDKSRSRETGGTGLGLAIVKHAVATLGATIALESEPDQGATFTLEFPVA